MLLPESNQTYLCNIDIRCIMRYLSIDMLHRFALHCSNAIIAIKLLRYL